MSIIINKEIDNIFNNIGYQILSIDDYKDHLVKKLYDTNYFSIIYPILPYDEYINNKSEIEIISDIYEYGNKFNRLNGIYKWTELDNGGTFIKNGNILIVTNNIDYNVFKENILLIKNYHKINTVIFAYKDENNEKFNIEKHSPTNIDIIKRYTIEDILFNPKENNKLFNNTFNIFQILGVYKFSPRGGFMLSMRYVNMYNNFNF
jgi:hypothetical protein